LPFSFRFFLYQLLAYMQGNRSTGKHNHVIFITATVTTLAFQHDASVLPAGFPCNTSPGTAEMTTIGGDLHLFLYVGPNRR
jgi:hypothetical protein